MASPCTPECQALLERLILDNARLSGRSPETVRLSLGAPEKADAR